MSEARKCDRCHGFYDIENEQQDRETPYEFKGDYVNLHLWVARNGVRRNIESRWYDLCPNCMMELECWLKNNEFPTICEAVKDTDCVDRSNGATEKELELASKLNDAKIYIAQLKLELGYTMTKEEIEFMKDIHNFTDEDISEAAKFVETKSSSEDNETTKKLCYFEYCKDCLSLIRKPPLPGETGYSEVRCGRWHTGIPMRGADPKLVGSITPDMFIKEEETKLSDPYEDGGL